MLTTSQFTERDWARHSYRILNIIDNHVRSLRKRQVIDSYKQGVRQGAYWGIRTNIADYDLPDSINCPFEQTMKLAAVATRLKALDATLQEKSSTGAMQFAMPPCASAWMEPCPHRKRFHIRPPACEVKDGLFTFVSQEAMLSFRLDTLSIHTTTDALTTLRTFPHEQRNSRANIY